ncbi:peptidase T [bacterium]|nr:peptidase T [bacterium]
MSEVIDRFFKYIKIDTQSKDDVKEFPSTEKQKNLAKVLVEELKEMGIENAHMDEYGYVYASIPATSDEKLPVIGFISHMDTSPSVSGKDVNARIEKFDGDKVVLGGNYVLSASEYPELKKYKDCELIVTDGTTLLGADDKAGVAEIMTFVHRLLKDKPFKHGEIKIAFTPDEEVGRGVDFFDVKKFGADYAYTVDGGELGEIEYENFNAASFRLTIHGKNIHPGSAKGKMKNAILMGMEFQNMLPVFENPAFTEKYEGFYHLDGFNGDVEKAELVYIIRDHDMDKFKAKKSRVEKICAYMNEKYGEGTFEYILKDSYYNMKEKVLEHFHLVENAKKAMIDLGVEPKVIPIRGGTDGARLSFMGLPCPNLCTGGANFHGRFEYIPVKSMEKITDILMEITKIYSTVAK